MQFREGVTTNKPLKEGKGSRVNIGLQNDAVVDKVLSPGLRVTVKLLPLVGGGKKIHGKVVSPHIPRAETGVYWGYSVRIAKTLAEIFSQSPYDNG